MKLENDFFSFLGTAVKAGKCVFGTFACEKAVKSGKALLIIADESLSERSTHDVKCMCDYYGVELLEVGPANKAAESCGKSGVKLIGVTDEHFKKKLVELSNIRRCDTWPKS